MQFELEKFRRILVPTLIFFTVANETSTLYQPPRFGVCDFDCGGVVPLPDGVRVGEGQCVVGHLGFYNVDDGSDALHR